jgi:hypothetical protein
MTDPTPLRPLSPSHWPTFADGLFWCACDNRTFDSEEAWQAHVVVSVAGPARDAAWGLVPFAIMAGSAEHKLHDTLLALDEALGLSPREPTERTGKP